MKKIHTEIIKNSNVNFFEMNNTPYEKHGLVTVEDLNIYINKEFYDFLDTKYKYKINELANSVYKDKVTFLKTEKLLTLLASAIGTIIAIDYFRINYVINNIFLFIVGTIIISFLRFLGQKLIIKSMLNKRIEIDEKTYEKEFVVDLISFIKSNDTIVNKEIQLAIYEEKLLKYTNQ